MSNRNIVAFDLETIPLQNLPDDMMPKPDMEDCKYGNAKDVLKRKAIEEEFVRKFYDQLDKRMATDPDFCQIVAFVGRDLETGAELRLAAPDSLDETALVIQVWAFLKYHVMLRDAQVVSFNGIFFDVPVLLRRAMYLDVSVDPALSFRLMQRQEKNRVHHDLMQILGLRSPFSGKMEVKSLDAWLKRFGISGKTGTGSQVYEWWTQDDMGRILDYCAEDVRATLELYERVEPWLIRHRDQRLEMATAA